nr:MAG TPA: Protein of unknown function (DUF1642) [Caudoviricetes sp.]
MNKQELIEYCKSLKGDLNKFINGIDVNKIIAKIEQLDEPQKPVVKQFVAEWYEENKNNLEKNIYDCIVGWGIHSKEIRDWMRETSPFQTLVNMHQFGYTVEKEKRYLVKAKGVYFNSCLIFEKINKKWLFSSAYEIDHQRGHHTRKELEAGGFGWVFDCPGVEIEEVEE